MCRIPRPSTLSILSNLQSPAHCTAALRALKNDIIGHEQRKEDWICRGVVPLISDILQVHCTGRHANAHSGSLNGRESWRESAEAEACLQAVMVMGSLACGGPRYVCPLLACPIIPSLLSLMHPADFDPSIVLASLKTLNAIADSTSLWDCETSREGVSFSDVLYADTPLSNLVTVLNQHPSTSILRQQIYLAAALISKTCCQETQRQRLTSVGVLETLAAQLASVLLLAVDKREIGSISTSDRDESMLKPPGLQLDPLLQAAATVITDSTDRTRQFAFAPALASVAPWSHAHAYPCGRLSTKDGKLPMGGTALSEVKLPLYPQDAVHSNTALPPLNFLATSGKPGRLQHFLFSPLAMVRTASKKDDKTPLFGWLLELVRLQPGVTRLMAAWMLSILFRAGLASPQRQRSLGLLVVPVLVRMLDNEHQSPGLHSPQYHTGSLDIPCQIIKTLAPRVLALLVAESPELQKAAADAGAIRRLSQLLKQSHDPPPTSQSNAFWSPSSDEDGEPLQSSKPSSQLGVVGLSPTAYYTLKTRESVLLALAALASSKDEYRKAIVDSGVVPFVIESLKPRPTARSDATDDGRDDSTSATCGNPTRVLLAACAAAQALSRSVSTLRTNLVDAGLATPLQVLLRSPAVEVQTAATAVIANIVLEFSPMRESVIDAGVLKTLCEHAHSSNTRLKMQSIWSLKHLVHSATNPLKMACLQELGIAWLMQVLCYQVADRTSLAGYEYGEDNHGPVTLEIPNAAGEQVDLLNAIDDELRASASDGVVDEEEDDDEDEVNMIDSVSTSSKAQRPDPGQSGLHPDSLPRKPNAPDAEDFAAPGKDAVAIQEQVLDFIRNLICGPESAEMIDFVLHEIGQERFFDMLFKLLRPTAAITTTRDRRMSGPGLKPTLPQPEIVTAVSFILIHIAAGLPRHRQLLLAQSHLMRVFVSLFAHPTTDVRISCAWVVINLTWTDDPADRAQSRSRAQELSNLGVLERLRRLEGDVDLDVRERTKQALQQIGDLLQR